MVMPNRDDNTLKTFNTAKKYAEDILFPKMDLYQQYQRQADFGGVDLNETLMLSEEMKDINRYNALKGMAETVYNLLINISSTVRLKGNKEEIDELNDLIKYLRKLKEDFYTHPDKFFYTIYKDNQTIEKLNREEFERIRDNINVCYVNTEILMTKNKLLFADGDDEFASDQEILEQIKKEYVGD